MKADMGRRRCYQNGCLIQKKRGRVFQVASAGRISVISQGLGFVLSWCFAPFSH
jgi:hypothetical protein